MDAKHDVLKFIFKEDECIDPDLSEDYIDKLCSIGIHSLAREPARLLDEKCRLEDAMKDEAFKNYPCFLEAHKLGKYVKQEILGIEDKLDKFIDKIPFFQRKLSGFSDEAKDITKRWRQASLMLSKHNQLLGFLEIPQLMDSCVRKGYYDEALQLYSYIQRIDRLHGKDAPLIQTISNELSQCKELMINQLLKELYGDIQLPVALKIIGYLRRINVYDETELRIKFLYARDAWLKNLVKEVTVTNPLAYMGKLIEIYRINLFNTVTQYRALFADDDIVSLSSSSKQISGQETLNDSDHRDFGDTTILTSWISNKIDLFLSQLQDTLDKCLAAEYSSLYPIENLFDPCFYFGLSMNRIGADCRPDISLIFQRVILTKFTQSVETAIDKFEANLENFSLSSVNLMTSSSSSPAISSLSSASETLTSESKTDYEPPSVILTFPPLANLCNDLLEAFNQARKLIPLSIIAKFRDILNQSLIRSTRILINYHKTESTSSNTNPEADLLKKMVQVYVHHLVPHIQKCLTALVPVQQLAKSLGLSVLEFNRLRKTRKDVSISDLDVDAIKELIDHLLV